MFSSSNNLNPFPQLPFSSSSSFHVPFTDAEAAAAAAGFFHNHHDSGGLLAGYLVPNYHTNAPIPHPGLINNIGVWSELNKKDHQEHGKKPVRKDRHSKISTAQGLRDRRVRLSIGVSREFFDLQDMLGFDTASKTLEWLLGKSKKDIQELEERLRNRRENAKNNSSSSNSDDLELYEDEEGVPIEKKAKASSSQNESRAKARERARERTREKICTTTSTKCPQDHHHHVHESNPELTQLGSHNVQNNSNLASFFRVDHGKPFCYNNLHHQQQEQEDETVIRSRDVVEEIQSKSMSSKGFVDWDISNARRSSICSTNLSTELQMYGNP